MARNFERLCSLYFSILSRFCISSVVDISESVAEIEVNLLSEFDYWEAKI